MNRIKFKSGEQRKFLKRVLYESNCPSLRAFLQFGFDFPYSTLKNYYSEQRNLPEDFFLELCSFAKLDPALFDVEILNENFGRVLGGKKSKRVKKI